MNGPDGVKHKVVDGPAAAASLWAAVAAVRSWAAAAHNVAAWGSCRNGWMAMSEAAEARRDAADAGAEAVGRDGRMNSVARKNTADMLRGAMRASVRARAAFKEAAVHAGSSAEGQERAARAYAMAGGADNMRELCGQHAVQARSMAQAADRWSLMAGKAARTTRDVVDKWAGDPAGRSDGAAWPGDRAAWVDEQGRIHADAEYNRAMWEGAARRANTAVRAAADDLRMCAIEAGKAAGEVERIGSVPPEARDAEAAWNEALEAARQVLHACQPGAQSGGSGSGGDGDDDDDDGKGADSH